MVELVWSFILYPTTSIAILNNIDNRILMLTHSAISYLFRFLPYFAHKIVYLNILYAIMRKDPEIIFAVIMESNKH